MEHLTEPAAAVAPARLAIEGELTIYTVAEWKPRLLDGLLANPALELDLSGVSEIDTAGQQLLMAAQLYARSLGRALCVSACSAAVADLLALCWLAGWFGTPLAPSIATGSAS